MPTQAALVRVEPQWQARLPALAEVRAGVPTPEHINDGYETKPSRRLETLLEPGYKKTRHGPLGAQEIGGTRVPHFKAWMDKRKALYSIIGIVVVFGAVLIVDEIRV